MIKVAIDLTWVRHNRVGGTESSIRNLLDGFSRIDTQGVIFYLFTSKDNAKTFVDYKRFDCFYIVVCNVNSSNRLQRVLWQNTFLRFKLKYYDISKCLEPIYSKPFYGCRGIDYYTIIHDLQALHFPKNFSPLRTVWMKISWFNTIYTSKKIIAISDYVRSDILSHYKIDENRVVRIYDAINICTNEIVDDDILHKLGIRPYEYYFTVSSLLPHKNLETIILSLSIIKEKYPEYFHPLVISGVGGNSKNIIDELIKLNGLENDVIITPYISDSIRNRLYKNCCCFLFPSVFEGFGMPVIEAMIFGCCVITTKETSLPEISDNLINYVDNPWNPSDWVNCICGQKKHINKYDIERLVKRYSIENIALSYVNLLRDKAKSERLCIER